MNSDHEETGIERYWREKDERERQTAAMEQVKRQAAAARMMQNSYPPDWAALERAARPLTDEYARLKSQVGSPFGSAFRWL